ncbi:MAG: circularly permuted type 2 ATP-grasp protein [Burkholderiaceae bacterium]
MAQSSFQFDPIHDPAAEALRRAVPARLGHFDELRGAEAGAADELRPAWKRFFETLGVAGFRDLDRRAEMVRRQIGDDGITYNVYSEDAGPARPWSLDLLPFIIEEQDWAEIERGVAQRASLLEAIVADAYGPQTLLREALLPPALVLGHPGYLRPLTGVAPPGGYLQIIAFDLARGADGQWWVVSQRTQAPSGLGYALQNRLAISRLFPDAFRELRVQRLASAYRRLLDTLTRLAPQGDEAPRIVVLTPGPFNETYFEHAYLARYLGLPLVEGADLTMRDERIYLKSLRGLQRVHGILRRLDDVFCDPLELRHDSALGIPGLLQAIRAGNVLVANALGTGFLESPALAGFLPGIARHLDLGRLVLPSLGSWWCGEAAARKGALTDLSAAVIKPTFPSTDFEPVIVADTSRVEMEALRDRIEAEPDAYTVQSFLPLSEVPTWTDERLVPRGAMLRAFAIAGEGGRWHVLPGGLTRIAGTDLQVVSMQRGGSSLDTWVLTDGPVDEFSMLPTPLTAEQIATRRRPVSSRAAENLFWMGRYSERAEWNLRHARTTLIWLSGHEAAPAPFLESLARLAEDQGLVPAGVPAPTLAPRVFERTLLADLASASASSLAANLVALEFTAAQIRDRLSPEHWRLVIGAHDDFIGYVEELTKDGDLTSDEALSALDLLAVRLSAITGAQTDRMTRDDGWRLLTIGRQIERLGASSAALSEVFGSGVVTQDAGFDLLLGLFDSTITYRSLYQRQQEIAPLIDLLVLDRSNPRSLACVLGVLETEVAQLPGADLAHRELINTLRPAALLATPLDQLSAGNAVDGFAQMEALAQRLRIGARELSDEIGRRFFTLSHETYQSLGGYQ